MKKDEACVAFMDTLLEGRGKRMKSLSQEDFDLVMKVMENPSAFFKAQDTRTWLGTQRDETKDVLDPELRQRVINEHMVFFKERIDELQQDIELESHSLKQMRESIQKDCSVLQDEIGKDEVKEGHLEKVGKKQGHASKAKNKCGLLRIALLRHCKHKGGTDNSANVSPSLLIETGESIPLVMSLMPGKSYYNSRLDG
jgi:hypothetical protein